MHPDDLPNGVMLCLRALPRNSQASGIQRLRRALKSLLREFGLRNEYFRELRPGELAVIKRLGEVEAA